MLLEKLRLFIRNRFGPNDDGTMSPKTVILLAIGIIVLANVLPSAIDDLFAVNTTTWDTGTAALWDVLPLIIVAVVILAFVATDRLGGGSD